MHKIIVSSFIVLWHLLMIPSVYAWQISLEVAAANHEEEKVYTKLVAGIEPDATNNFDNLWDTPALISSPDPETPSILRAYFTKELEADSGKKYLWKDIRGPVKKGDTLWHITVDSVPEGKNVVLKWEVPQGLLKTGERLVLEDNDRTDADGKPVDTDMIQTSSYEFVSTGEDPRSLSLVLSKEPVTHSRSGSGSGFGCGTTKRHGPSQGGPDPIAILLLFSPLVLRLFRWRWATSQRQARRLQVMKS